MVAARRRELGLAKDSTAVLACDETCEQAKKEHEEQQRVKEEQEENERIARLSKKGKKATSAKAASGSVSATVASGKNSSLSMAEIGMYGAAAALLVGLLVLVFLNRNA